MLMEGFELEWNQNAPLFHNKRLASIYFGGGTPSLLGAAPIAKILSWIKNSTIEIAENIEITLEANPENISTELIRSYADAGINRISVGIQSFDDELLQKLNRLHSSSRAFKSVEEIYAAGIQNISIDLMYDLPGQTLAVWKETLRKACDLPISHLSLYNLTIEPHTVFYKYQKEIRKQIPDDETSLQMVQTAIEYLNHHGLAQYEISAFAKDKCRSHHNTGYWTGRPFYGLGPSAFSDWEGKRFRNVAHLHRYLESLQKGLSPIDFEEMLEPNARRRELFTINLRLLDGVDLPLFQSAHGPLETHTEDTLKQLEGQGFIKLSTANASLTQKGIFFYDTVASELI